MAQPVDTGLRSVASVLPIQSGKPAAAQLGPVAKAFSVPQGVSSSARKRESPSPLLDPQPQPLPCGPINDSLSSATNSAISRFNGSTDVLANVASRYIVPPVVKSQP